MEHIQAGGEALQELSVQFQNQIDNLERSLGRNGLQDHAGLEILWRLLGGIRKLADTAQRISADP